MLRNTILEASHFSILKPGAAGVFASGMPIFINFGKLKLIDTAYGLQLRIASASQLAIPSS